MRALLAMVAVLVVANLLLPDFGASMAWAVAQGSLSFFLAALAGGWLAGRRFLVPALALWAATWLAVGLVMYRIAAPVTEAPLAGLLASNWLSLGLSGLAVAAGVRAGALLRDEGHPDAAGPGPNAAG